MAGSRVLAVVSSLVLSGSLACALVDWRRARSADTPAAYHRFLREHPHSLRAGRARERRAYLRLLERPSPKGLSQFREQFPRSNLLRELETLIEEKSLLMARSRGTADAYAEFLAAFPDGPYVRRAEGNAEYLRERAFGGRPHALEDFADRFPESDYAAEALRSVETLFAREETQFDVAVLEIDIDSSTPGPKRLRRVFTQRATRAYRAAGLRLLTASEAEESELESEPARLEIRHREASVGAEVNAGTITSPGILATTVVTLTPPNVDEPTWSREFTFRASSLDVREGDSILFGVRGERYWSSFFVPVARWGSREAVREPFSLDKPVAAVDAVADRAVVLFEDGHFRMFHLSDPNHPSVLFDYTRPRDLTRWSGVRIIGDRVAIFGPDGLEIVSLYATRGPTRVINLDRGQVGSITDVEPDRGGLFLAGQRGLFFFDANDSTTKQLLSHSIHGLSRANGVLLFTDGTTLFAAKPAQLFEGRIQSRVRLGNAVGPRKIRAFGSIGMVLGDRAVLVLDLSNPLRPRPVSRIRSADSGVIRDGTIAGGRLFLLGNRGLQLFDPVAGAVTDSADVRARHRIDATGRHLIAVGAGVLQVIDATGFVASGKAVAAPQP